MVSIRAPAWGATQVFLQVFDFVGSFNSRSRVGSDFRLHLQHRPTQSFNSRSRVGSDKK